MAEQQLEDSVVLATMMLALDEVDGLVSGAIHTTASTIRPALQLIKTAPGYNLVSSVFSCCYRTRCWSRRCAVNPDPSASDLAEIAVQECRVGAGFRHPCTGRDDQLLHRRLRFRGGCRQGSRGHPPGARAAPDLLIDGPLRYDAAAIASVGRQKAPNSPVAGQATVFIFPDLNTGNTEAVQRSADCVSVGPMLQGLPANR